MSLTTEDPDILVHAQIALDEADEAANNSFRIIGLCKKPEFQPTGSEAGSITRGWPPPGRQTAKK
jgi:hypothetical protein